jgi:hypothetical protein
MKQPGTRRKSARNLGSRLKDKIVKKKLNTFLKIAADSWLLHYFYGLDFVHVVV